MICYLAFVLFILKTIDKDQPLVVKLGILAPTKGSLPCKLLFKTFFCGFFMNLLAYFHAPGSKNYLLHHKIKNRKVTVFYFPVNYACAYHSTRGSTSAS
jgi:hypothetical protein